VARRRARSGLSRERPGKRRRREEGFFDGRSSMVIGWAERGKIQARRRKNERGSGRRRIIENFYLFEGCKESIRKLVRTVP